MELIAKPNKIAATTLRIPPAATPERKLKIATPQPTTAITTERATIHQFQRQAQLIRMAAIPM